MNQNNKGIVDKYSIPEVSIIYVNYYGVDEIIESIKSILLHSDKASTYSIEFIVVSNSPIAESARRKLNDLVPPPNLIELEKNIGFARANNIGANQAKGKYLFFLNPDTTLINDVLDIFIHFKQSYPKAGILGPATYNNKGNKVPSVKKDIRLYSIFKWLYSRSILGVGPYPKEETGRVDVVNGSAIFISKDLFIELGGMCEAFFMYWEEHDLCVRCRALGYPVWYIDEARIQHVGGTSTREHYLPMEIEKHRSLKKFLQIHHPNLVFLNRLFGSVSYFGRAIVSTFLFKRHKIRQFGTLFIWYTFLYH